MPPLSSSKRRRGFRKTISRIGFAIFLIVIINIQTWIYLDNDSNADGGSLSQYTSTINSISTISKQQQQQQQQQQRETPQRPYYYYPYPVFVVGMPKVGTTSIYNFFNCNGIKSSHYCCCGSNRTHTHCNDIEGGKTCSECIRNNIKRNRPMLEGCGDYKVYAQLDAELGKSVFLPQRFHLDKLHTYAPDATFILNLRPPQDWLHSVTNWFGLGGRFLTRFNVDIDDPNTDRNKALLDIFNNHSNFIRNFTRYHPTHKLLEVDISQHETGAILAHKFGLKESCWGRHNVNKKVGVKWN